MNKPLRRVGLAMMLMVVLLLANDMYVQVVQASSLSTNTSNSRRLLNEYSTQRGLILSSDMQTLVTSTPTNDTYKFLRQYANGPAYADVTGYYSLAYGAGGMEDAMNGVLNGTDDRLFVRRLSDLITGRNPQGGDVQLTINPKIQLAGYNTLVQNGFTGAAVAIQPSTGQILGMVSTPSYDPNGLAAHDNATQTNTWKAATTGAPAGLMDQPIAAAYQPGSTFKLVVASAALSNNTDDENTPNLPSSGTIPLPQTSTTLSNYNNETCPDGVNGQVSMKTAIAYSCNTAFATLAGKVGESALAAQAAKFGFGQNLSIPLGVATSCVGPAAGGNCLNIPNGTPGLYQSGIGQLDVQETPLQNALIAATIANGGTEMYPQLVKGILGSDLSTVQGFTPQVMNSNVISSQTAATITDMMLDAETHSGTANKNPAIQIAAKTGTAEHGPDPKHVQPYGWYVAFAPNNDIAVAVVVTSGGSYDLATVGAKVAGPVGRAMINASVGG
ncbi:MAG TPA: penicillin-binding transpeptidase domain-containing protein [Pseudonocardiaceae bacterium]|jgi:peptidoglycan glycosyltransferase|nr:penicillin-binding transpeptidase domain-containing protein [Pseudonocardiaceae bacterium]